MRTEQHQDYVFEAGVAEHTRLVEQATLFDPLTERLLVAAGVGPGMRVLTLARRRVDVLHAMLRNRTPYELRHAKAA